MRLRFALSFALVAVLSATPGRSATRFIVGLDGLQQASPNAAPGTGVGTTVTPLLTESTHVNIHTNSFPAGEIRGQVLPGPVPTAPDTWGRIKRLYR